MVEATDGLEAWEKLKNSDISLERALDLKNATLTGYNMRLEKDLESASDLPRSILPPGRLMIHTVQFESVFLPSTFVAGEIQFSSAGHPSLLFIPGNGIPYEKEIRSIPIGMFSSSQNENAKIEFQPGDVFYLFSDGFHDCIIAKKSLDK